MGMAKTQILHNVPSLLIDFSTAVFLNRNVSVNP